MKKLIFFFFLLCSIFINAQSKENTINVDSVDIVVTVDSLEEIESTLTIEDVSTMFNSEEEDVNYSFKIICNGAEMDNGVKSNLSYKIEGNSSNNDDFIKRVKSIREAAIKYYKNKQ